MEEAKSLKCGCKTDTSLIIHQSKEEFKDPLPIVSIGRRLDYGQSTFESTVEMKMAAEVRWLLTFHVFCLIHAVLSEVPHRKFEYKYSFKPPYLAQKDGSVPFWEYGGSK